MRQLNCTLLHHTPLWLAANGCRMSHNSHDKSDTIDGVCGPKDADLIKRIGIKMHHESILEFLTYTFDCEMTTKDLLAFSRHRVGISLTMQSTRYTTKQMLKSEAPFSLSFDKYGIPSAKDIKRASKYIHITGNALIDAASIKHLDEIRCLATTAISNDDLSLMLPQAWVYRGQIQLNARSLRHFFSLRAPGTHAHPGMQDLALRLSTNLPDDHKYLFEDFFNAET